MSEIRFKLLAIYLIAVISAFLLKKVTYRIATKAIQEKKLSTGFYRFFPAEGEKAVELAKGHIRGVNIYFWFVVLIFPIGFFILLLHRAV